MTRRDVVYLPALGIVSALGRGKDAVRHHLFAGERPGVVSRSDLLIDGSPVFVGAVGGTLPSVPEDLSAYASRNLALTIAAADEIRPDIEDAWRWAAGLSGRDWLTRSSPAVPTACAGLRSTAFMPCPPTAPVSAIHSAEIATGR